MIVPDSSDVTITVTSPLRHLCPHKDEVDNGTITVIWRCNGATFELHSLRELYKGFKGSAISHEQLTDRIRHDLSTASPLIDVISVSTWWTTAGMEVTCSTSPTRAETLS